MHLEIHTIFINPEATMNFYIIYVTNVKLAYGRHCNNGLSQIKH
jgi:hypothetical protein